MSNPCAVVTGSSRGIGRGIALALAEAGYNVVVNGVRPESDIGDVLDELKLLGVEAVYSQADIGTASGRENLLSTTRSAFGRLDLLVNNAGVAPRVREDILDASEESFEHVLRINLQGPHLLTQAAARWMVAQKESDPSFSGTIVFITSISSIVASVSRGDYCISKAGLSMAAQLWATRLSEYGVSVYEVRPGLIETDMTSAVTEKYEAMIADGLLLEPRWGTPEDIGKAVRMLARGDLPYATGQVLTLDGGLTSLRL